MKALRSVLTQLALDFAASLLHAVAAASPAEAGALAGVGVAEADVGSATSSAGAKLVATLTARERMIFEGALHGASNGTLSRNLGISVKTVQTHRAKINLKLGVHSPAELVRFAVMHGMLTPGHAAASGPGTGIAPTFNLAEVERQTIDAALRAANQNRTRAAALLGIPASVLAWKLGGDERARPAKTGGARRPRSATRVVAATPAEEDPAGAITDPWRILDAVSAISEAARQGSPIETERKSAPADAPPATRRSARVAAASAEGSHASGSPSPPDRRPAARPGEDILVASGGGAVLRRRRSSAAS